MFNKKVIRVVAIVMAALVLLGGFGAAISAFAAGNGYVSNVVPATGQRSSLVPFIVGGIALLAAIICVVLSRKSKNAHGDNVNADYIKEDEVENGLNFFTSKKEDTFVEKPKDDDKN